MILYTIKDDKAQAYQGIYSFANDAIAVREFDSLFQAGKLGLMNQYPADFALYKCGNIDDATGAVVGKLELVKNFSDFVNEVQQHA